MLTLVLPARQIWDDKNEKFLPSEEELVLTLEHSLAALSKWESMFEKPFLDGKPKTTLEMFAYIDSMVLTPECPEGYLYRLSEEQLTEIDEYLNKKSTATWFSQTGPKPQSSETITSELVYYWMNIFSIPFEAQHWNFNRLMVLIEIHTRKNAKPKKESSSDIAARRRALNEQRLKEMQTNG